MNIEIQSVKIESPPKSGLIIKLKNYQKLKGINPPDCVFMFIHIERAFAAVQWEE